LSYIFRSVFGKYLKNGLEIKGIIKLYIDHADIFYVVFITGMLNV